MPKPENPLKASSLAALSSRDQGAALALFNGLDSDKQAALVKAAVPEDKKELLFLSRSLPALLDSLPGRDVYLALECATASEFDTLVGLIGPEHLNFLLAMGCWRDGAIDDARVLYWLDILNNADDASAARAMLGVEADFLAAALWRHLDVSADEDDARDAVFLATPDQCRCDNETVEDFLVRLYETDRPLFELVCHRRATLGFDEVFESARLAYSRRLEKEGLPSYEDAARIYEEGWTILRSARLTPRPAGALIESGDNAGPFLAAAMRRLEARGSDVPRLAGDFAALLVKLSVADGGSMDSTARRRMVQKAELYAGLGLERESGGDADAAADLLSANGVTPFFKAGYDMVSELRKIAEQLLGSSIDDWNGAAAASEPNDGAVLHGAARELPCMMLGNGKARTIWNLREFLALKKTVIGLSEKRRG
jgi:hypothetical protein